MPSNRLHLTADAPPNSTARRSTGHGRSDVWTGWALSAVVSISVLMALWNTQINHDTAWFLLATKDWLDGAELYKDIVEVNPPLNFYLTIPAVILSEILGISLANAQFTTVAILFAGVLGWCWRLLPPMEQNFRIWLFLTLAAALILPFRVSVAQREHFMLLLMMPWVIGQLSDRQDGEIARAAIAALGLCLKPFFMLYPVALTLLAMANKRSWRPIFAPANLIFLLAGSAYVAAVLVVHPQYFTEIVPVARHVYGEYGLDVAIIFKRFGDPGLILGGLLLTLVACRIASPALCKLCALLIAALVIYFIQWTGFRYQIHPFVSIIMIGLGWMLFASEPSLNRSLKALTVLALALMIYKPVLRGPYFSSVTEVLSIELMLLDRSTSVMTFSTSLPAGPAVALRNNLDWTSRFPALWLIPGVVDGQNTADCATKPDRCKTLAKIEAQTRADILTDLRTKRPDILIFDYSFDFVDTLGFSWDGFLSVDPSWDEHFAEFELVRDARNYDIYRRRDLPKK